MNYTYLIGFIGVACYGLYYLLKNKLTDKQKTALLELSILLLSLQFFFEVYPWIKSFF